MPVFLLFSSFSRSFLHIAVVCIFVGLTPSEMIASVTPIDREHMWDLGGIGGLLKGQKFRDLVHSTLPVKSFEECNIPLAVTAYDVLRFRTNCITDGHLATAMCASCTFPGLFQPVMLDGSPHIDGGVWDGVGLMALPHAFERHQRQCGAQQQATQDNKKVLVVNIVFDRASVSSSRLPRHHRAFRDAQVSVFSHAAAYYAVTFWF
jgi:predicted acylesterase/phospholipase RssA